jgi:hypothetical protein
MLLLSPLATAIIAEYQVHTNTINWPIQATLLFGQALVVNSLGCSEGVLLQKQWWSFKPEALN